MYYRWQGKELLLSCRIQPKANQDAFAEIYGDQIKIQIKAPPVDGKANQHLIKFLAKQFRTPQKNVLIESGLNTRSKRVRILAVKRLPPELNLRKP